MQVWNDRDSVEQVKAEVLSMDNVTVVATWAGAVIAEEIDPFNADRYPALNVQCKDEVKRASLGDYVIMHLDGSMDVLTPLIFRAAYTQDYM